MVFCESQWAGGWVNFEAYLYSSDPYIRRCWADAEAAAKGMPAFSQGIRNFWQRACSTVHEENPVRLAGWQVEAAEPGLWIRWLGEGGKSLGRALYLPPEIVPKGLEGKENFLFRAEGAPEGWPFSWLLAMAPMPGRQERHAGGLLSHLHFQFSSQRERLFRDGRLCQPAWYATMCDGSGTLLEQCNIIRALHRLPLWEALSPPPAPWAGGR